MLVAAAQEVRCSASEPYQLLIAARINYYQQPVLTITSSPYQLLLVTFISYELITVAGGVVAG